MAVAVVNFRVVLSNMRVMGEEHEEVMGEKRSEGASDARVAKLSVGS